MQEADAVDGGAVTAAPPRRPWRKKRLWIAAAVAPIAGCLGLLFVLLGRAVSSVIH